MRTAVAEQPRPDGQQGMPNQGSFLSPERAERLRQLTGSVGAVANIRLWHDMANQYPREPDPATLTFEYGLPPLPNARPSSQEGFHDRSGLDDEALARVVRGLRRNSRKL